MRRNLTKQEIVKRQPEINQIFKTGKTQACYGMKMVVSKNQLDLDRIVVIPVRHFGNAVQRNRIRRQIKEIWRNEKPRMIPGYDFAFVVYPGKVQDNETQTKQLISLCEKAGVFLQLEDTPIV
ncbi:ribonuclease P protein component [uncultured Sphaerochaeta sp.]|uniref:ribonuclease P protein component n=1 Tax=uncultured Sphaerochaeta sp. TaxID=886478 RepID=UPI002A0A6147|nr:ribonuclease P protein component [uncultured Sphaerochaeta sp.]